MDQLDFFHERAGNSGDELVTESSCQRTIEVIGGPGFLTVRSDEVESRLIAYMEATRCAGFAPLISMRILFRLAANSHEIRGRENFSFCDPVSEYPKHGTDLKRQCRLSSAKD